MTQWNDLPQRPYDVILADPPWSYYGQQNKWTAAAKFYRTAPDAAIAALPMADLLTKRGVLFLWATSPRLDAAMACLERQHDHRPSSPDGLTRLQTAWLDRRICGWCNQRLTAIGCGEYPRQGWHPKACNMVEKRANALLRYRPRRG